MNSELSKLLGRDFFIAFFLPALFFLGANWLLVHYIAGEDIWSGIDESKIGEDAVLAGLAVWIFGIFLQAFNRQLFRFVEGYWPKRRWFTFWQLHRYRKLQTRMRALTTERQAARQQKQPFVELDAFTDCWRKLATRYPSTEDQILPTGFGNIVRAYEDYPRVMYAFESINGWPRLQAFISKQFNEVLGKDRAHVDLWLNLSLLSCAMLMETGVVAWRLDRSEMWWFTPFLVGATCFCYIQLRDSAEQYGEQVKAAFDIYLPPLARAFGYELSADRKVNSKFWLAFSQMMIFREPRSLDAMASVGLPRIACLQTGTPAVDNSAAEADADC
jgi:hypothetical protein